MAAMTRLAFLLAAISFPFVLLGCGDKSSEDLDTSIPSAAKMETSVPDLQEIRKGIVTFLTGDVVLISSGAELYPEIGDPVYPGDKLTTGTGAYAELQFGEFGAIRIQESTEYTVETLPTVSGRGKVIGTLASGTVLAKVKKLGGKDIFEVNVPGAVCAVRGTKFLVNAAGDGVFTIAVAEGAVSVAPPSLSALKDSPELEETLEQLRNLMPTVSASEEITARDTDFQEAEIRLSSWLATVSEIGDAELSIDELRDQLTAAVAAVPKPAALNMQRTRLINESTPEIVPSGLETPQDDAEVELAIEDSAGPAAEDPVGTQAPRAIVPAAVPAKLADPPADILTFSVTAKTPIPGIGTGSPVSGGGLAVAVSPGGTIFAVNESGSILWRTPTKNTSESVAPVIEGNRVFALGNKELVILDLNTGDTIQRRELTGYEPSLFGRRPLPFGENLILPTYLGLVFMNSEGEPLGETIPISDGLQMSPTLWKDLVLTAGQRGSLHFINPSSRTVLSEVETASIQPVAQAPAVSSTGIAVFSGRRGEVSAVNLISRSLMWERKLNTISAVISDAVIESDTVFVYADDSVFALDLRTGDDKYEPIADASGPPMASRGTLFVPHTSGTLGLYRSRNGKFLDEISLDGEVARARPVALGESVAVFGSEHVVVVDPRSITQR